MSNLDQFGLVLRDWASIFMHQSMRDFRRLMEETGLSHAQISVLFQLGHCESCGISEIGESLGISNAAASQLVERLVQRGLIWREEDAHDRRFKRILLTEQGRAILEKSIRYWQQWVASLTAALNTEEQRMIIQALTLLSTAARQLEISPAVARLDHPTNTK